MASFLRNQIPNTIPMDPFMNNAITATERATRSVFVGNIPYEATEEQLKEIFIQAGPVVSFRLVYDRETGKPKGYGFCEYQDLETAQSAMRNLNNHDFNGRPLRVGIAAGENNKDEIKGMQQALGGPVIESPYGDQIEPEKAPEAISQAVASLPPEQMFELMKQMKLCIQNNPNEARNMLLANPQLAYALLQAQIVMKIVDPQVALTMLYRENDQSMNPQQNNNAQAHMMNPQNMGGMGIIPSGSGPPMSGPRPMIGGLSPQMGAVRPQMGGAGTQIGGPSTQMGGSGPQMGTSGPQMGRGQQGGIIGDMRGVPTSRPDMGGQFSSAMPQDSMDPRMMSDRNMPSRNMPSNPLPGMGTGGITGLGNVPNLAGLASLTSGTQISAQDQEKAALIMQVLQLTDQQISILPPEQRQSILILKEQIAKSAQ